MLPVHLLIRANRWASQPQPLKVRLARPHMDSPLNDARLSDTMRQHLRLSA